MMDESLVDDMLRTLQDASSLKGQPSASLPDDNAWPDGATPTHSPRSVEPSRLVNHDIPTHTFFPATPPATKIAGQNSETEPSMHPALQSPHNLHIDHVNAPERTKVRIGQP